MQGRHEAQTGHAPSARAALPILAAGEVEGSHLPLPASVNLVGTIKVQRGYRREADGWVATAAARRALVGEHKVSVFYAQRYFRVMGKTESLRSFVIVARVCCFREDDIAAVPAIICSID